MALPVILTRVQHAMLHRLQSRILPISDFNPEDVEALRKIRMIRVVPEDKLSITGIGIDYLLTHWETPLIGEQNPKEPLVPKQPVLPLGFAEALSPYAVEQLRTLALNPTLVKHIHARTRANLIKWNLIIEGDNGALYLSDIGRAVVEQLAPLPPVSILEPPTNPQPSANGAGTSDMTITEKGLEGCAEDCAHCLNGRFLDYLYQSIPEMRVLFERFAAYEKAAQDYEAARDALAEATDTLRIGTG